MQEVDIILNKLIEAIKTVDSNKAIPYLVKDIDKLIYDMYYDLHALRGVTRLAEPVEIEKKGHCC